MTANLTRWTPDAARIYSIDLVRGMPRARPGAAQQQVEVPHHSEWGRFANHFGTAHKAFFITADTMTYDFGRIAPIDFAFIDGGHDLEHVLNDSRKTYEILSPGGLIVWHDFQSPVPWVKVREAIELIGFAEPVVHVEGTEVAFLRKGAVESRQPAVGSGQGIGSPSDSDNGRSHSPLLPGSRRLIVSWEGDFAELHSLALVNRALCRRLTERGIDVRQAHEETRREPRSPDGDNARVVHVRHRWPARTEPPEEGRWVLMQPWEYGSLPKSWLPMLGQVDEVWAYSRHVRDCYLRAGVPQERVQVIPLGVDPDVFRPRLEALPLPPGPRARFLFVGGTIFRKGIDVLLKAFGKAFSPSDGVGLVIKDMGASTFYRGQSAGARISELRDRGYSVEYIDRELSDAEMAGLYAACDCLVHPFRGEGFALPIIEAMACGLPVIVTDAGPALDYATEDTAFLIPARPGQFAECRVGDLETIDRPWLFEPDLDALVGLLPTVASDLAAARVRGAAASEHIRSNFTWERTTDLVERRLQVLATDARTRRSSSAALPGPDRLIRTAKVSLTMIVKNEEKNLPACLASVRGLFDETVVVDTGSTDRTRQIAQEFGARVFDFVWVDDFAAARNAALARATGDYAFWLDADDVIDPSQREQLGRLLTNLRPDQQSAYVVRCFCDPEPNGNGGQTVVDHIRLFPLREEVRWTYRVHEQILPALRRANVPVKWTDVTVRHTGYTDGALRERKLQRDCRILEEELAERPNDPFVLFNLGSIAVERQDWPRALDYLRKSLSGSAPTDSITRKLFALIGRCHQMLGDLEGALAVCAEGLSFDPNDAELLFRKAVLHRKANQPAEAESTWRRILTLKRPEQFCSVDQGIYGHLTLRNLAALAAERGDRSEEERLWHAVLAECPGDAEAIAKLAAKG
jgi:glycosyltransferase involved in cell wall biosynthesis/tetratricopeptide (TPR) repeat protein